MKPWGVPGWPILRRPSGLSERSAVTQLLDGLAADRLDARFAVGRPSAPVVEAAGPLVPLKHPQHGPLTADLGELPERVFHQQPPDAGADQGRVDMDRIQLGRALGLARP